MSAPQENVFGITYSGIQCNSKEEAIHIADYLAAKIQSFKGYNALGFIVLSNMDADETLVVTPSQHKTIIDESWFWLVEKDWHIHISFLSIPGDSLKKKISDLLKGHYPSNEIVYVKRDPNVVGEYANNSIGYFLRQSVILRTFVLGDPTALDYGKAYHKLFVRKAKEIGYSRVKLMSAL